MENADYESRLERLDRDLRYFQRLLRGALPIIICTVHESENKLNSLSVHHGCNINSFIFLRFKNARCQN